MATKIARMDALAQAQVSTLTPTAADTTAYTVSINTKQLATYTSGVAATVQQIVEALQPLLDATVDSETIPEATEVASYTEDNLKVIATGLSTGKPFTLASTGAGTIAVATTTAAKSKNHWIAENFSSAGLPANGDEVIISQLTEDQSILYGLDQNTVTLDLLEIRQDSAALIGLDEYDDLGYFQYRDTHLKIGATACTIGEGVGDGSRRINLNLHTAATTVIVYNTAAFGFGDDSPVHLLATNPSNKLQVLAGIVDLATKAGTSSEWQTIRVQGGTVNIGKFCTFTTLIISGTSRVKVLSDSTLAAATISCKDSAQLEWIGDSDITQLTIDNTTVKVIATDDIEIGGLVGFRSGILDLSECRGTVTITSSTIYSSPDNPFTIIDPNNRLIMTNPLQMPVNANGLVFISGSDMSVTIAAN